MVVPCLVGALLYYMACLIWASADLADIKKECTGIVVFQSMCVHVCCCGGHVKTCSLCGSYAFCSQSEYSKDVVVLESLPLEPNWCPWRMM